MVARVAPAHYASRLKAAWFVAEEAGGKSSPDRWRLFPKLSRPGFLGYLVEIAMVSKIALLMATPVLKRSDRRELDEACVKGRSREYWGRPRRRWYCFAPIIKVIGDAFIKNVGRKLPKSFAVPLIDRSETPLG